MALTIYDWAYGTAQFSASFLAVIAGLIAFSLFRDAFRVRVLNAWKFLLAALIFFAAVEVVGGLRTFGVIEGVPFLTHMLTSLVLVCFITALVVQINIKRGWHK